MQPNQRQRQQALQVDITKVIDEEAAQYGKLISQLMRDKSVLAVALGDLENENSELHAKLAAATGASFTASGPGIQFPASAPSRSGHAFTAPVGDPADERVA